MRGKRELHTRRRLWKSLLLSAVLLLGLTVVTPWSPTADLLLASHAAAAVSSGTEPSVSAMSPAESPAEPAVPQPVPDGPEEAPEEPPVLSDEDLFSSAAFVGDSRTEGFQLYSGLEVGAYFCAVGATVQSVTEKPTQDAPGHIWNYMRR